MVTESDAKSTFWSIPHIGEDDRKEGIVTLIEQEVIRLMWLLCMAAYVSKPKSEPASASRVSSQNTKDNLSQTVS